jgi:hypothetical protein
MAGQWYGRKAPTKESGRKIECVTLGKLSEENNKTHLTVNQINFNSEQWW